MTIEQSRSKHLAPGQGKTFRARGDLFFFKVVGTDSDGGFSMCEVWNELQGGIPPHIDHRDDEVFFVLEGTYECLLGDRTLTCGVDETFFAPRGTPHAIKNVGDTQARILIVQSPGGVIERYMEEAWETIDDPSNPPPPVEPDFERVMAVAHKYGIEMLPPA
ncbi:MAG TPA: cupin domain-containing protein [Candidatus Sulfotelmatobacter sp.]|nr:cupin domain-containing protein [Candidatus Sulfotelmatobacter sp.]